MHRRTFLKSTLAGSLAGSILGSTSFLSHAFADTAGRPPRVLLRSSWQTVNIGDIAHTPGVLSILQTHLPAAEITLWPSNVGNGVEELLLKHFPKLKIAKTGDDRKTAFAECDFLLHGSGPSLVAERDVVRWRDETGKPYGVYGITLPPKNSTATVATSKEVMQKTIDVLSGADFVFFRDSKSLAFAKEMGCTSPVMEFGPDGAFACDLRQEKLADEFLDKHGLEPQKYLCCIPRLRYTPYWTIPEKKREKDPVKHARNEEMKEHDHAQLLKAIVEVVEATDLKVLICPEDRTQMQVGEEVLYDKLPKNVLDRVVCRPDYWLTGEAVSTYVKSAGLFGNEMHSPIMCIGHGVPAIVCRWEEQTTKGYMWEDIGLGDWLFNLDNEEEVANVAPAVLAMAKDPAAAQAKAAKAKAFVEKRQLETMTQLEKSLVAAMR